MRAGDDKIEGRKEDQTSTGYFGYMNSVYKLGYQYSISNYFHVGVAGSVYEFKMDTVKGYGTNMDMGLVFSGAVIDLSLTVKNIIKSSKIKYTDSFYNEDDPNNLLGNSSEGKVENIPLTTIASARYKLKYLNLYGEAKTFKSSQTLLKSGGIEVIVPFMPILSLSGGYREYYKEAVLIEGETSDKVIKSGTIGVGLDLFGVNFDYALEKTMDNEMHSLYQLKHYFSVGLSF